MTAAFVRLDGADCSLLLDCRGPGIPLCLHWGAALAPDVDPEALAKATASRLRQNAVLDRPPPLSLMPEAGLGFFGAPGLEGHRNQCDWATAFELQGVEEGDHHLLVKLADPQAGLSLDLEIDLHRHSGVISRRTLLTNRGSGPYALTWLAAAAFALPEEADEALLLHGAWSAEFGTRRVALGAGQIARENRRGRTSHASFPGCIVGRQGFDDLQGEVYGFHLGWGGNHRLLFDHQPDAGRQVQLGELLVPGEIVLQQGESYRSPWVHAAWSPAGLNDLSQRFHAFLREEILPQGVAGRPRPVHYNTWEAIYFDHDEAKLLALAEQAAALGVERFVLDDGWFPGRSNAEAGLGDWRVDPAKYPQGLGPLIAKVRDLGMDFGLWVEPEMVNPDSDLYRQHPDWVLQLPGRERPTGRHQLVLDLTRPEVADHLFQWLDRLLADHAIAYLKWDHNRDLAPAGDAAGRPAARRQTLALYALLDRLRAAHPEVEIESCASGGGRADYEVLRRTERIWTSDNNDALARQTIQRGASLFFPLEVMGAHVGPAVSHTAGRRFSLDFRAGTALFGHFGLEFDLAELSAAEQESLKHWIALYKRFRPLLHFGRLFRLPFMGAQGQAWLSVAEDRSVGLAGLVCLDPPAMPRATPLRLPGLDPAADHRITLLPPVAEGLAERLSEIDTWLGGEIVLSGRLLAGRGIAFGLLRPHTLALLHIEKV
ncbi:alpha-galactosidase, partial [Pelagibius sp.]|uniref:alpha-galactosidase n=1 Tax=Pelagibius sp. TaxID=1931238 RepID=UPI00261AB857